MISKSNDISAKDYELFLNYSKELGLDRTMVQAAGGNTSIKDGDTMWIKASGKWLLDTGSSETMAAVSISKIKDALKTREDQLLRLQGAIEGLRLATQKEEEAPVKEA